jgi:hypothetical protein
VPFDCCGAFKRRTVHITVRYMPSEQNTLSDAASRRDAFQFFRASREWLNSHSSSLNSFSVPTNGRASLIASSYGTAGGAAGLLVQYLVEGHNCSVSDSESQVDRILNTFSTLSKRFVAQEHRRLHHVSRDNRQEGRDALALRFDQGLLGLFGSCDVLYVSSSAEPSPASGSATVPARSSANAGQASGQSGAMHIGTSESIGRLGIELSDRRGSTVHGGDRDAGVLGLSSSRRVDSEAGRQATISTEAAESRNPWDVNHRHSAYLKDDPVRRVTAPH